MSLVWRSARYMRSLGRTSTSAPGKTSKYPQALRHSSSPDFDFFGGIFSASDWDFFPYGFPVASGYVAALANDWDFFLVIHRFYWLCVDHVNGKTPSLYNLPPPGVLNRRTAGPERRRDDPDLGHLHHNKKGTTPDQGSARFDLAS